MGEKVPVRIYLREETVEALRKAAEAQTDEMTYNEVAAEVVTRCLPIWTLARQAFDEVIDDFLRQTGKQVKVRRKPE